MEQFLESKKKLDVVLKKSRVHLYKPIQVAEILYRNRLGKLDDLNDLEQYRSASKRWRDEVSIKFVGRVSTSSAKYQDDIFNQISPEHIDILAKFNRENSGIVEYYIYSFLKNKLSQLDKATHLCDPDNYKDFYLSDFINSFESEAGLKRSLDKVFEIVIYALFEALTKYLNVRVNISYPEGRLNILKEFRDFYKDVIGLSEDISDVSIPASFNRVGVTNAADRGLDIYVNFGSIVQIKHMSLSAGLAENVVTSINSDRVILVCKDAEKEIITSVMNQLGWGHRIQAIITFDKILGWYEKIMRGEHSGQIGKAALTAIKEELSLEFPMLGLASEFEEFCEKRDYLQINQETYKSLF